jgi:sugar phosphate isomerase/epimerase
MGATRRTLGRDDLIASVHPLARVNRDGVARVPFAERVAGAAAAGFAAIGTSPRDYLGILDTGLTDDDIEAVLDEHGLVVGEIDSCPLWTGEGEPDREHRRLTDVVFHLAERFAPVHHAVVPLGTDGLPLPPHEVLAERLDELAVRAGPVGLRLAVEFVPWGHLADVGDAWDVVRRCPSPLVGVNFDFWHHLAGRADADMVRRVPGDRIHSVHYTDGIPDLTEPDPLRRTMRQRKLPGAGAFPMVETIRLLDEIGADLPFTVEVVSLDHRDLSPDEFLVVLHEASRRVLDEARAVPGRRS